MEYQVDSLDMIFDMQPVADVEPAAVYGQRPVEPDIVYHKRYQLLGKLV